MKNNIILTSVIILSALAHVLPIIGIAMVASGGDESIRAIGTMVATLSCFALGYLHGWNKTNLNF